MFNEMYQSESVIRNHYNNINEWLEKMTAKVINEKNDTNPVNMTK